MLGFRKFRHMWDVWLMRRDQPDYQRLVAQEALVFEATEMISELWVDRDEPSLRQIAEALGNSRSEGFARQILAGDREMSLRTLSNFAHVLGYRVRLVAEPLDDGKGMKMENDG